MLAASTSAAAAEGGPALRAKGKVSSGGAGAGSAGFRHRSGGQEGYAALGLISLLALGGARPFPTGKGGSGPREAIGGSYARVNEAGGGSNTNGRLQHRTGGPGVSQRAERHRPLVGAIASQARFLGVAGPGVGRARLHRGRQAETDATISFTPVAPTPATRVRGPPRSSAQARFL